MLVDVTLENSNGATYCIHGKLIYKDSTSVTVSHIGGIHPIIRTYRDKILDYKECKTVKGLARRVLNEIHEQERSNSRP